MKSNPFQTSLISTLFVCGLLLTASQAVLAAKPIKPPPIVTDAVVVDFINSHILVTGSGFDDVTEATLGGADVTADIDPTSTDSNMVLGFSAAMAAAVPGPGSYSLTLNGIAFSVYISSAIFDPVVSAVCPCQAEWESFGSTPPPDGFSGVAPSCNFESAGGDQIAVELLNSATSQIWILTSEFNTSATNCALVIDGATQEVNAQEHVACSTYLKAQYFTDPPADNCLFFP